VSTSRVPLLRCASSLFARAAVQRARIAHRAAGRGIFYPLLNGTSKGDTVVLTKRMFDDDEMVLGKWMASMGKILL
jgi:alanine dehydrogenase